jgi:uncharacterized protein YbjT (DUF2867 family)
MKVVIAGSRTITDITAVERAVKSSGFKPTVIFSGMARGVDTLALQYARSCGLPVERFYAAWKDKDGALDRTAGFKRNAQMANLADALVAVWDGKSRGTKDMIDQMCALNKPVFTYVVIHDDL